MRCPNCGWLLSYNVRYHCTNCDSYFVPVTFMTIEEFGFGNVQLLRIEQYPGKTEVGTLWIEKNPELFNELRNIIENFTVLKGVAKDA